MLESIGLNSIQIKDALIRPIVRLASPLGDNSINKNISEKIWNDTTKKNKIRESIIYNFDKLIKKENDNDNNKSARNLISNGNFKNGLYGWENWGYSYKKIIEVEDTNASNSLLLITNDPNGGIKKTLNVKKGDTITYSAYFILIKYDYYLKILIRNSKMNNLLKIIPNKIYENDNKWHRFKRTIVYDTTGNISIHIGGGGLDYNSISLWTNIQIEKGDSLTEFIEPISKLSTYEPNNIDVEKIIKNININEIESFLDSCKLITETISKKDEITKEEIIKLNKPINLFNFKDTFKIEYLDEKNYKNTINFEDRTNRWRFGIFLYTKHYNIFQKLIGRGFDFFSWFGKRFYNDKDKLDWPHNPFIHILLYSGITGVIIYIIFVVRIVQLYWKYRKQYPLFGIFFLITYYFTFFSGGNPFDPPVMGFFMMLPFFIHAVHKREEKEKEKKYYPK